MTKWYIFLIVVLFNVTFADNHLNVKGRIIDSQGNPVADVQLTILPLKISVFSDDEGRFQFSGLKSGNYELKIVHMGYQTRIFAPISLTNSNILLDAIVIEKTALYTDEITVTATRQSSEQKEISVPINVIGKEDVSLRMPGTTAELLQEQTGLYVQKTNHGGGSPIIRGLSSSQVLILVDGIRLNNSTYRLGNHQYLTTVDIFMLDKVEVVRGPGSVLYGSDALGGVINTLTPKLRTSDHFKWASAFLVGGATADNSYRLNVKFNFTDTDYAFEMGSSIKKFGDLYRGENSSNPGLEKSKNGPRQSPSAYDGGDINFKWLFKLSDSDRLTWGYQYSRQNEVPRYDKYENEDYHLWLYEPQERHLGYLRLENDLAGTYFQKIQTTFSYHHQSEGRKTQINSDAHINEELDDVQSFGLTAQTGGKKYNHKYVMGIDAYFDKVNSGRFLYSATDSLIATDIRGRYPDGAVYLSAGIYASDSWSIGAASVLNLGGRFSYFHTDFATASAFQSTNVNFDEHFSALTFSASLVHQLSRDFYLDLGLRQGFRAPNLSDLSKVGESKGSTYEIANTDLQPEKLLGLDLGLKMRRNNLQFELFIYYSYLNDLISSAPDSLNGSNVIEIGGETFDIRSKQNVGSGFITGIESGLKWHFASSLSLYGNFTWTYGENTKVNDPIGGIPPIIGKVGLYYDIEAYRFDIFSRFAGKQDRLSEDDMQDPRIPAGGTPGWFTLNIRFLGPITKDLNFAVGVENIMDLNYREHGSGINGPGRNYLAQVNWIFGN